MFLCVSQDNFVESVLFFMWDPQIELRLPGLCDKHFTHRESSKYIYFNVVICTQYVTFYKVHFSA